jgi:hypothetical protein
MQNDKKNLKASSREIPRVKKTTVAIIAEQERQKAAESLPQSDESVVFESSKQSSSSKNVETPQDFSNDRSKDHGKQPARGVLGEAYIPLVPVDCQETNDRAMRILEDLQHDNYSRVPNHFLLIDDLKELGMLGELPEDSNYISMPFEDVRHLAAAIKMAEAIQEKSQT